MLNPAMRRRLREAGQAHADAVQEREDVVAAAYNAGGGMREIAELVGMSHVGVSRMLKRLGIRRIAQTVDELNREARGERLRPE